MTSSQLNAIFIFVVFQEKIKFFSKVIDYIKDLELNIKQKRESVFKD